MRSFTSLAAMIVASGALAAVHAKAGAAGSGSAPPAPPAGDVPPPPAGGSGTQAATGVSAVAAEATGKPRNVAPKRSDIPPPPAKKAGPRAGTSLYDFGGLEIGESFAVLDKTKTAKKFGSTVTAANHRYDEPVKDAEGKPTFEQVPVKDANGNITSYVAGKAIVKATRKFVCADVNPATDPDGATVRVWRVALPA